MLASGVATGVAGGLGMMFVLAIAATAHDLSPMQPWSSIGESFLGAGELDGTGAKAALGAVVHLATAAVFGVLFAAILPRDMPATCAMGLGAGLALFAMGFMMSVVVPWVNPGFREAAQVIGGSWVIAHGVFGAVAGLAAPMRRWFSREASDATREGVPARA
jgi:hypothetical protein